MDKSISNFNKIISTALISFAVGSFAISQAQAGVIAESPMMLYPGGGVNFLIIYGNDSKMDDKLGATDTKKSRAVKEAVSNLFKQGTTLDTSSTLYKAVNANYSIGMGLMTYGGTSDTSPYLWPLSASPYTTYPDEITNYCKSVSNNVTTADWGDMFYLGSDPKAHPYCLPVNVPRPSGYWADNGECRKEPTKSGLHCYERNGHHHDEERVSTPDLGKLIIPIEAKNISNFPNWGETFGEEIDHADPKGGNDIEGAMLTACDYFNSHWLDKSGKTRLACSRGYPSSQTDSDYPQFKDAKQGYSASVPNIPNTCGSANIFITDGLPNTTADGQSYTANFDLKDNIPTNLGSTDPFSYSGARTDPSLVATRAMYQGTHRESIRTFFVGLGMSKDSNTCLIAAGTSLNLLACAGYDNSAKAYYPATKDALQANLNAIVAERLYTPMAQNYDYTLTPLLLNEDAGANSPVIFKPTYRYSSGGAIGWVGDILAYVYDGSNSPGTWNKVWSASENLNYHTNTSFSAASRLVFTYNPVSNSGADLQWANLTTTQKTQLGNSQRMPLWLRGDTAAETGPQGLRVRSGHIFGDIVNSKMTYVGSQDYSNDLLPEGLNTSEKPYKSYLQQKTKHIPMIYVGANDGLLHGFSIGGFSGSTYDKSAYSKSTEVFAYLPNAVITSTSPSSDTLSRLTKYAESPRTTNGTYYPHVYSVDGQMEVGDAYIKDDWKTVLVGTTGAGAKGIFTLDITCPVAYTPAGCSTGISKSNVMWEISDTDGAASTPNASDAASIHNDLGFTYAKPSIARLNNGKWAVIVGNGYYSANGHAVLFIFDLESGSLIRKIDTGIGGTSTKNGLSSTTLVDTNTDRMVDYVYAGDLYGNVWKFDLRCPESGTCSPSSAWVAPEKPLLIACQTAGTTCAAADRQPITQAVLVDTANNSNQSSGLMVYVGTGQYYELGDNVVPASSPPIQSIYGLWDKEDGVTVTRDNLSEQVISAVDSTHRKTVGSVDYTSQKGWFIDLREPGKGLGLGERVFQDLILHEGTLFVETLIPHSQSSCVAGGGGWNWQLDSSTGGGNSWGSNTGVAYTAPAFFSSKKSEGGNSPGSSVTINTNGEIVKPEEFNTQPQSKIKGRASWNQIQ